MILSNLVKFPTMCLISVLKDLPQVSNVSLSKLLGHSKLQLSFWQLKIKVHEYQIYILCFKFILTICFQEYQCYFL